MDELEFVDSVLYGLSHPGSETEISRRGIHYDQLSPEVQARFEKLFAVEAGEDTVSGSAINKWFFNVNIAVIVKALNGNVA